MAISKQHVGESSVKVDNGSGTPPVLATVTVVKEVGVVYEGTGHDSFLAAAFSMIGEHVSGAADGRKDDHWDFKVTMPADVGLGQEHTITIAVDAPRMR